MSKNTKGGIIIAAITILLLLSSQNLRCQSSDTTYYRKTETGFIELFKSKGKFYLKTTASSGHETVNHTFEVQEAYFRQMASEALMVVESKKEGK